MLADLGKAATCNIVAEKNDKEGGRLSVLSGDDLILTTAKRCDLLYIFCSMLEDSFLGLVRGAPFLSVTCFKTSKSQDTLLTP